MKCWRRLAMVGFVATLVVVAPILASCGGEKTTNTQSASTTALPVSTTAMDASDTTKTSGPGVSRESIAYAEQLGGTSHEGDILYVIIGASVPTEAEAQQLLEQALPSFGDMQPYFIVQRSDNFEGMEPGWWVVMEAHYSEPDTCELEFGRRGFPDAYVKKVTVSVPDPIPVYEDMVGTAEIEAIRDVIAQSGAVPTGFELCDCLITADDKWAGVIVGVPEQGTYYVLLFHSGVKGWQVMTAGTYLTEQGLLDQGAPAEIATYLACYT